jgi:septal ring-binding cell division protein DamX
MTPIITVDDMNRVLRSGLCCALLLVAALTAGASRAHAQDATLDRVQNLAATGRFTEARTTLERWERSFADPRSNATASDRARALYLRGVLTTEPQDAEDAFLAVVLSYPSSPSAPGALLRLGQARVAAGDPARAVSYLERLRSDYPGSADRETGMLWLARAQLAAGSAAAACTTARDGLGMASNANLVTLFELERDNSCAGQPAVAATPPAQAPTFASTHVAADPEPGALVREERAPPPQQVEPGTPVAAARAPVAAPAPASAPAPTPPAVPAPAPASVPAPATAATPRAPDTSAPAARTAAAATSTPFAVQIAAFSQRRSAESAVRELRAKGFTVRIVHVDDSPLFRVRYGAFASRDDASDAARRIRAAGFEAFVVTDVSAER